MHTPPRVAEAAEAVGKCVLQAPAPRAWQGSGQRGGWKGGRAHLQAVRNGLPGEAVPRDDQRNEPAGRAVRSWPGGWRRLLDYYLLRLLRRNNDYYDSSSRALQR